MFRHLFSVPFFPVDLFLVVPSPYFRIHHDPAVLNRESDRFPILAGGFTDCDRYFEGVAKVIACGYFKWVASVDGLSYSGYSGHHYLARLPPTFFVSLAGAGSGREERTLNLEEFGVVLCVISPKHP